MAGTGTRNGRGRKARAADGLNSLVGGRLSWRLQRRSNIEAIVTASAHAMRALWEGRQWRGEPVDWQSPEALVACAQAVLQRLGRQASLDRVAAFLAASGQEGHPVLAAARSHKTADLTAQLNAAARLQDENRIAVPKAPFSAAQQSQATQLIRGGDATAAGTKDAAGGPEVCRKSGILWLSTDGQAREPHDVTAVVYPDGAAFLDYVGSNRPMRLSAATRGPSVRAADVVDWVLLNNLASAASNAADLQLSLLDPGHAAVAATHLRALDAARAAALLTALAQAAHREWHRAAPSDGRVDLPPTAPPARRPPARRL